MSLAGALTINPVEFPLVGQPSIRVQVLDNTGNPVLITSSYIVKAFLFKNADDANPLLSKASNVAGQLYVTTDTGYIYIPLSTQDVQALSPQWLYSLIVTLVDAGDGTTVKVANSYTLIPLLSADAWTLPTSMALLSTNFLNTLSIIDYVGGAGYLDGVATVLQPVGCWIEFSRGTGQPETWELCTWTDSSMNTNARVYQQPLDFNSSTNPKVWVRRV